MDIVTTSSDESDDDARETLAQKEREAEEAGRTQTDLSGNPFRRMEEANVSKAFHFSLTCCSVLTHEL